MSNSSDGAVEYRTRIKEMPENDRPRERLVALGPDALSEQELLAILLRTGSEKENAVELAARLLSENGGLAGLARLDALDLQAQHGLGPAKAAQVVAAMRLGIRAAHAPLEQKPVISSPGDVVALHSELASFDQEHLRVIRLNTRNHVLGSSEIYIGNVHSAIVRMGEIFRDAVRDNAPAVVILHNHPSGDPAPSPDDIKMTQQALKAGEQLDIEVLDHVVMGRLGEFVSMKERRLAFT
jgi:DNA repair protein RadC